MIVRSALALFVAAATAGLATSVRAADAPPSNAPAGVRPVAADGRVLNLDLESGTLADWTADGDAFKGQPVKGDLPTARGRGQPSSHQGQFWVGGYEVSKSDDETGTLTSAAFKVTHRWATFMVGGGHWPETRVELISAADGKAFFKANGTDSETLRPVLVDLEKQVGQEIRIRVVDDRKGAWGHTNYDDFRFFADKPSIKAPPAVAAAGGAKPQAGPADVLKHAGLSPADAARAMILPPGFKAQVFAAEPDIINPIAFTIDARGRLWVVQSFTYPNRAKDGEGKDSILVLEDTDGDGKADKRTVFAEKLNLVSGIELGFGGVYVGAAPYLLHIPADVNADDPKPTGEPKVLLDGWGYQDTHETLNSFTWGPDGWLYGCHGVFTNSFVGKPGTPKEQRTHINAGIWRYHPTKHVFERFAEGTSNPWGMDFDERGQLFIEACVIPHLWHVIQNARYQRQAGQHDNPYTFDDIKQIADHVHYQGATPHAGNNRSDSAGGGHAHSGMMVYLGDNWPAEYRGKLFMNNIHGARINMDVPEPEGSGFVGRHGKDFLLADDRASQFINMKYGPDGAVYVIDWYDLNQCHNNNPASHDRTTGRIFKIGYGDVKRVEVELAGVGDQDLARFLEHKNAWFARTASRLLAERQAAGLSDKWTEWELRRLLDQPGNNVVRLRAMWTLHGCGKLDVETLTKLIVDDPDPYVAGWAMQLLSEDPARKEMLAENRFWMFAETSLGKSPVGRLYLASALHRMPAGYRTHVLHSLVQHPEDAKDHNLPLMYWYGIEAALASDAKFSAEGAIEAAWVSKVPGLLAMAARRQAMVGGPALDAIVERFARSDTTDAHRLEMLRGLSAGLKGRRDVPAPKGWDEAATALLQSKDPAVADQARTLAVVFGSKAAMADMTKKALDRAAPTADRLAAIDSLLAAKDPTLATSLQQLLDDPAVRGAAIRGLAQHDDAGTPGALLGKYGSFSAAEKKDALLTLAGRPAYAKALLGAVDNGVPKADFTADVLRQIRTHKDAEVVSLSQKYWAAVNETEKDKLAKIGKYKSLLVGEAASGNARAISASHGRLLFNKTCAQCHTMFAEGGKVGPDITGADRSNLDYLLLHVVDPNAVIPADYRAWTLDTKDDRSLVGVLKRDDAQAVVIQTANETVTVARADVAKLTPSPLSMMPEGLIDALQPDDLRDLFAYLKTPAQVPVLADADAAKQLFNGKDLTGWEAIVDDVYSVENGEIVGRSKTGLKKNQFLTSKLAVRDFRLVVKMKLTPDTENSGIQFRSVRLPNSHEMMGTQADAGQGWWGKVYEESGRGLLFPKKGQEFDGTKFVNKGDWNVYEIVAVGGKIRTAINGNPCTDLDDDEVAKEGVFGLQVHSGGPIEVRWKDFELELDPKFELKTVKK